VNNPKLIKYEMAKKVSDNGHATANMLADAVTILLAWKKNRGGD
jgi:hypothetical protein